MPASGPLAVDDVGVDADLEHTAAGGHQGQLGDVVAVLGEKLGRQTGGTLGVASDVAVLDRDAHAWPPHLLCPVVYPGSAGLNGSATPVVAAWRTASATAVATSGLNTLGMM